MDRALCTDRVRCRVDRPQVRDAAAATNWDLKFMRYRFQEGGSLVARCEPRAAACLCPLACLPGGNSTSAGVRTKRKMAPVLLVVGVVQCGVDAGRLV